MQPPVEIGLLPVSHSRAFGAYCSGKVLILYGEVLSDASQRIMCPADQESQASQLLMDYAQRTLAPGWGDKLESLLAVFGITKERYASLIASDCNCAARQNALNQFGRKVQGIFARIRRTVTGETG